MACFFIHKSALLSVAVSNFLLTFAVAKIANIILLLMKKIFFLSFFLFTLTMMNAQNTEKQSVASPQGTHVKMTTTYGDIMLLLYDATPLHRDNFLKLVADGTYNGLLFHRVIPQFMVQAGDPTSRDAKPGARLGAGTLGYTIPAEILPTLCHKRGALCAARQGDQVNPKRESSASQFYIVQGNVWRDADLDMMAMRFGKTFSAEQRKVYTTVGGTPHLDGEYTVFGEVLEGMDVVDRIAAAERDRSDRPLTDIRIISVEVVK